MEGRPSSRVVSGKGKHQIYGSISCRSPQTSSSSSSSSSSKHPWGGFTSSSSDPESKRRKRIANYKVYTIQGRVKASFRNGIRWIKSKFIHAF